MPTTDDPKLCAADAAPVDADRLLDEAADLLKRAAANTHVAIGSIMTKFPPEWTYKGLDAMHLILTAQTRVREFKREAKSNCCVS